MISGFVTVSMVAAREKCMMVFVRDNVGHCHDDMMLITFKVNKANANYLDNNRILENIIRSFSLFVIVKVKNNGVMVTKNIVTLYVGYEEDSDDKERNDSQSSFCWIIVVVLLLAPFIVVVSSAKSNDGWLIVVNKI
jgi:hypothetical protein